MNEERDECEAPAVVFRDFPAQDAELGAALEDAGFVRIALPDSMLIEIDWSSREEFLAARSKRERRFHREKVLPWENAYSVEILRRGGRRPSETEWAHLYGLYRNVQQRRKKQNQYQPQDWLQTNVGCHEGAERNTEDNASANRETVW